MHKTILQNLLLRYAVPFKKIVQEIKCTAEAYIFNPSASLEDVVEARIFAQIIDKYCNKSAYWDLNLPLRLSAGKCVL